MSSLVHKPVMVAEVLAALRPKPEGSYVDGTVGAGGHASAILRASGPSGRLYGSDRDSLAIEVAARGLGPYAGRFELRVAPFSELAEWIGPNRCEGVILDLGVSSIQLSDAQRGFSFDLEGPLDMRMNQQQTLTAADLVNGASVEELARIFREFGGERHCRLLARAIVREREKRRLETTRQLEELMERVIPQEKRRIHPATRVFQALRIAVNDELGLLRRGLDAAWTVLKPVGRLAVITFHSLEDRIVKEFGRKLARDYAIEGEVDVPELRRPKPPELKWVYRKALRPSASEIAENPRSRSAQLRVMEKI